MSPEEVNLLELLARLPALVRRRYSRTFQNPGIPDCPKTSRQIPAHVSDTFHCPIPHSFWRMLFGL